MAETIRDWGLAGGYFSPGPESAAAFHDELAHMLLTQKVAFNSPHPQQRFRHFTGRDGDTDAGVFERRDFRRRRAFAAADDGARVTHAASRRRGRARDETGNRLFAILLDPLGGFFFRATANFTNHYNAGRFRVVVE